MASVSLYVPGSGLPVRPSRAAQIAAIKAKAKASEAVVNLMCALAFGEQQDDSWPEQVPYTAPPIWNGQKPIAEAIFA